MCAFVARLADIYHETLSHICILHPFPCFGATEEQPAFAHAISKVVDPVTEDRPHLGLHVWDLGGSVLNEDLTIGQLHPNLQGHILLGEALARLLRPPIGDTRLGDLDTDATLIEMKIAVVCDSISFLPASSMSEDRRLPGFRLGV
ncbi:hypothetical protein BC826DRAFT_967678 [Russula brevipes]|nr:hypothetical protein BC826DRAFT_967678 [Russula brevipes]